MWSFPGGYIYIYQHLPKGAVWPLRDGVQAPLIIHSAPLGWSRYRLYLFHLFHQVSLCITSGFMILNQILSIVHQPYHLYTNLKINGWNRIKCPPLEKKDINFNKLPILMGVVKKKRSHDPRKWSPMISWDQISQEVTPFLIGNSGAPQHLPPINTIIHPSIMAPAWNTYARHTTIANFRIVLRGKRAEGPLAHHAHLLSVAPAWRFFRRNRGTQVEFFVEGMRAPTVYMEGTWKFHIFW